MKLEDFKTEIRRLVEEADAKDGSGPDMHAQLLEILLTDIKKSWDLENEATEEVVYVLNKVFPDFRSII